jgi:ribosomal small subunit protein bTHX
MGRGDKRTRRGKIARHSFGKSRPKATKPAAVKKTVKAVKKKAAR